MRKGDAEAICFAFPLRLFNLNRCKQDSDIQRQLFRHLYGERGMLLKWRLFSQMDSFGLI